MDKTALKKLLRECIEEVLTENLQENRGVQSLDKDGNWVNKPDGFTTPTPKPTPSKPPRVDFSKQMSDLNTSNKQMDKMGLGGLDENDDPNNPLYVEYVKPMNGEQPFVLNGEKFEYCWAKYPNGKVDIGVYAYAGDMCYGYKAFRERYNLPENHLEERVDKWLNKAINPSHKGYCTPMTKPTCTPHRKALAKRFKKGLEEDNIEESGFTVKSTVKEMTGTSAVQGFYGKNWVDPDPERKKMKSIAARSVGGEVS